MHSPRRFRVRSTNATNSNDIRTGKLMGRNIIEGIAGVLIAGTLVFLVEMAGHAIYPIPASIDFSNEEAMRTYVSALPLGALLFVGGAWFVGALGGTFAACKIGRAKPEIYALVVGGFMLAATLANLVMIPHPLWFSIAALIGIVIVTWLGMRLGSSD